MQAIRTPTRPLGTLNDNLANINAPQQAQTQKKKVKPSELCQTPPTLIKNKHGQSYLRGLCIGEGGFARCFQVNDKKGDLYAAKTLAKASLKSEKTRAKLLTEIKIHRALKHPHVVQFVDCFEDHNNVYILLEMCSNQSLMDMVRRRKRLTEVEARLFMVQILGAVNYMHSRLVVHRDLKLGNIFIDSDMNIKIGDFGLAARLDTPRQRRKTVCGTPNYISPEVLLRPHEHSFPADIWAAGIILYAMLFGNPPFQEKNVDVIYQRIKNHDLKFPSGQSDSAKDLIRRMLDPDQYRRATIQEILNHEWMNAGPFVTSVPASALRQEPVLYANAEDSRVNMITAKLACGLSLHDSNWNANGVIGDAPVEPVTAKEISQSESEGQILPQSISPPSTKDKYQVVMMPEEKKATAEYDSPVVTREVRRQPQRDRVTSGNVIAAPSATRTSTTAAAAAAMAASEFTGSRMASVAGRSYGSFASNIAAPPRVVSSSIATAGLTSAGSRPVSTGTRDVEGPVKQSLLSVKSRLTQLLSNYDPNAATIGNVNTPALSPPVYVTRWADFDETWGLAYGLTDGAVGIYFRDGTSMRMDPLFDTFMYYESKSRPGLVSLHRTAANTPDRRRGKKVEVMKFVHNYMEQRLGQAAVSARSGGDCCDGVFVHRFSRLPQFAMFVLSNGTLQFNFRDHIKIVLSNYGQQLTVITDQRQVLSWPLEDVLEVSRAPYLARLGFPSKLTAILEILQDFM